MNNWRKILSQQVYANDNIPVQVQQRVHEIITSLKDSEVGADIIVPGWGVIYEAWGERCVEEDTVEKCYLEAKRQSKFAFDHWLQNAKKYNLKIVNMHFTPSYGLYGAAYCIITYFNDADSFEVNWNAFISEDIWG